LFSILWATSCIVILEEGVLGGKVFNFLNLLALATSIARGDLVNSKWTMFPSTDKKLHTFGYGFNIFSSLPGPPHSTIGGCNLERFNPPQSVICDYDLGKCKRDISSTASSTSNKTYASGIPMHGGLVAILLSILMISTSCIFVPNKKTLDYST
jgi:hypothetical protein